MEAIMNKIRKSELLERCSSSSDVLKKRVQSAVRAGDEGERRYLMKLFRKVKALHVTISNSTDEIYLSDLSDNMDAEEFARYIHVFKKSNTENMLIYVPITNSAYCTLNEKCVEDERCNGFFIYKVNIEFPKGYTLYTPLWYDEGTSSYIHTLPSDKDCSINQIFVYDSVGNLVSLNDVLYTQAFQKCGRELPHMVNCFNYEDVVLYVSSL